MPMHSREFLVSYIYIYIYLYDFLGKEQLLRASLLFGVHSITHFVFHLSTSGGEVSTFRNYSLGRHRLAICSWDQESYLGLKMLKILAFS